MIRFTLGVIIVILFAHPVRAGDPGDAVAAHPAMTTAADRPICLPQGAILEISAGAALSAHILPSPSYGYVLSGTLRVTDVESGKVSDFATGDFVAESADRWHVDSNPGDGPLKFLAIDQAAPAGTSKSSC